MKTSVFYLSVLVCVIVTACSGKQKQQTSDNGSADFAVIMKYKNPYVGNNSNTVNLFNAILLTDVPKKYQIDSEKCILTVHVEGTGNRNKNEIRREVVYSSIASMAAIDNLSAVVYDFPDYEYTLQRKDIETILGDNLAKLLNEDIWYREIESKIDTKEFVDRFEKTL